MFFIRSVVGNKKATFSCHVIQLTLVDRCGPFQHDCPLSYNICRYLFSSGPTQLFQDPRRVSAPPDFGLCVTYWTHLIQVWICASIHCMWTNSHGHSAYQHNWPVVKLKYFPCPFWDEYWRGSNVSCCTISTVIMLHNLIEQCTTEAHYLTFKKFHGETQTVAVWNLITFMLYKYSTY